MKLHVLSVLALGSLLAGGCGTVQETLDQADDKISDGLQAARSLEGQIGSVNDSVDKYKILAQAILDSSTVVVGVGPDGTFRIDSIGGKPVAEAGGVILSILDAESNLAGVVTSANSIGLAIDSQPRGEDPAIHLGTILVDTATRSAMLADSLSHLAMPGYTIAANAQADLGAVSIPAASNDANAPLDRDHDGMPDLFDADAGNNGILDALEDGDSLDQMLRRLPGLVREYVMDAHANSVFLPVAGSTPMERQRSYLLQFHVRESGRHPIDSILVEGPKYLDSCQWKIIGAPGTPGNNRPDGMVRHLSNAGTNEGWHAELYSPTGALFRMIRPGDVISFRIFSNGNPYRAFSPVTWVFRETPMLVRYLETIGGSTRSVMYADSLRTHPPIPGGGLWMPSLTPGSSLRLEIDLMRLRTPLRNALGDSTAGIASLQTFLKDDRYEVEFWTEGSSGQFRNRRIAGPVRVDAQGDSVGWRFLPGKGKAVVYVPRSLLRDQDNRVDGDALEPVTRYKLDLSMWDRIGNKTSLQVLFGRTL